MSLDGGVTYLSPPLASGEIGTTWSLEPWSLSESEFSGLTDETEHILTFKATDLADNIFTTDWHFYKDVTSPTPVMDVQALPAGSINISWTSPAEGDFNFDRLEIYRIGHPVGYPVYSNTSVAFPDYSEPSHLVFTSVDPANNIWEDSISGLEAGTRNIYYYQIFTADKAGNYSAENASAQACATNYLLGDVAAPSGYATSYDNIVNFEDLAKFSMAYGSSQGETNYDAECDFGPTDDNSRFGIPQPWSTADGPYAINFEDLMIFAMNYYQSLSKGHDLPIQWDVPGNLAILLEGEFIQENSESFLLVTINLKNSGHLIKGVNIDLHYDDTCMQLLDIASGGLFRRNGDIEFFESSTQNGKVIIVLALLGQDAGVYGSGEVAALRFSCKNTGAKTIRLGAVNVRDIYNRPLIIEVEDNIDLNEFNTPLHYSVKQNYPNPFNNETIIYYTLPEKNNVKVEIYNFMGQRVKVLIDEEKDAGYHKIVWNAKDAMERQVSTGLYFSRFTAGEFQDIKKLIYMK